MSVNETVIELECVTECVHCVNVNVFACEHSWMSMSVHKHVNVGMRVCELMHAHVHEHPSTCVSSCGCSCACTMCELMSVFT